MFRRTVDHVRAVEDVSLTLAAGRTLGVVGESGSGKTSLALALLRLCPSMGGLMFAGGDIRPLRGAALRALRRRMQPVFQDPFGSLSPRMTIADIVAEGLKLHEPALPARARDAQVCRALEDVRLDPALRHRYPHEFSGGQRQRVALARALILSPDLLVLDEPTSALDRTVQADILKLLRDLQQDRGLAYLLISHDLRVIRALAHDVAVMRGGRVVEQGPAERIFSAPQQAYSRALLAAAFEGVA